MPGPQRNDVEESVPPSCWWEIAEGAANVVAAVQILLGLAFLVTTMLSLVGFHHVPLALPFIIKHPGLAVGIPGAVFTVALCIKKWRAASRIGVNGDCENGGTAEVLDDFGSDGDLEHGIVQPPMLAPPVVTIPSSSSSRSGGGVLASGRVVTAADVEMGGASHHRRGEREIGVRMSGGVVRDGKKKNA